MDDRQLLEFYEDTCDEVYRYASRLVAGDRGRAEDLVQETYLTLVRQLRAGRAQDVNVGWALRTCRSRFIDGLRRSAAAERAQRRAGPPSDRVEAAVEATVAGDPLAGLPDLYRAALVLHYVDDLPTAEVARLLGRGVRATESLLVRARQALRSTYQEGVG